MKSMKRLLVILGLITLSSSILGMQKETHITLVGKDGKQINIARETAQRIPTIQNMLTPGLQEAETRTIKFELFDGATLQSIVDIVEEVYTQAPVLKLDPLFFEQTDKHPAYTPADIPEQVRNIITAQGLQNNTAFMQAADFLGLDWVQTVMQGGKSIADLIAYNQSPPIFDNTLDLKNKNITSIVGLHLLPQDIRDNLQHLWLHNNQLTSIPEHAFAGLNNLQMLGLSNNQLTSIADNAFAGLNNLQQLSLTSNQLTSIAEHAFTGLNNLQHLWLSSNQLTSIADNVFAGLNNLQQLRLGNNQLTSIAANAFTGLNNLQQLWLGNNQLTSIPEHAFAGLNNLQLLSLSNNQLTSIADNVFAGLNNLQQLRLKDNQLDQATKDRIREQLPNVRITF
ncbi:MAG TPA: leucine-rich repeat protein [Candidatus Dependentiae bacterium]|nr:leucine-rich repeat protein [Candidatus Dependentiae bacterium]HRQ63003.1 leucine-rich repeat protein [Candidatus Dependentiae bacterium]